MRRSNRASFRAYTEEADHARAPAVLLDDGQDPAPTFQELPGGEAHVVAGTDGGHAPVDEVVGLVWVEVFAWHPFAAASVSTEGEMGTILRLSTESRARTSDTVKGHNEKETHP